MQVTEVNSPENRIKEFYKNSVDTLYLEITALLKDYKLGFSPPDKDIDSPSIKVVSKEEFQSIKDTLKHTHPDLLHIDEVPAVYIDNTEERVIIIETADDYFSSRYGRPPTSGEKEEYYRFYIWHEFLHFLQARDIPDDFAELIIAFILREIFIRDLQDVPRELLGQEAYWRISKEVDGIFKDRKGMLKRFFGL